MVTAVPPLAPVPTPVTGILSPAQAGPILGVSELAVYRLIARRRLPAAPLEHKPGQRPKYRIISSDVDSFFSKGAKDLHEPRVDQSGWVEEPTQRFVTDALESKLSAYSQSQRLSDEKVAELCKRRPHADTIDVELTYSPQMREVFNGPPQMLNWSKPSKEAPSRLSDWGELWSGVKLVVAAHSALDYVTRSAPQVAIRSIERFYASPEVYEAAVARAIQTTLDRYIIVWSEMRARPASSNALQPTNVRLSYGLRVNAVTTKDELKRIAEIAF